MLGERRSRGDQSQAGQGLVEFAMVIPFVVVLFMGLLEMALAGGQSRLTERRPHRGHSGEHRRC